MHLKTNMHIHAAKCDVKVYTYNNHKVHHSCSDRLYIESTASPALFRHNNHSAQGKAEAVDLGYSSSLQPVLLV